MNSHVEVHIERLVLDGLQLGDGDAERLRAALVTALTEALRGGSAAGYDRSADARRRVTTRLAPGASPAVIGSTVGRAVATTLQPRLGGR